MNVTEPTSANLRTGQVARLIRAGYTFTLTELDGMTTMTADDARSYIEFVQRSGYRATAPRQLFNTSRPAWIEVDVERTPATPKINAATIGHDDELAASIYGQ